MPTLAERPTAEIARKNLQVCILDDEIDQVELPRTRLDKAGFPAFGTSNAQDVLQRVGSGTAGFYSVDSAIEAISRLHWRRAPSRHWTSDAQSLLSTPDARFLATRPLFSPLRKFTVAFAYRLTYYRDAGEHSK
jgi:hypothetical protein